jgi:hypothetical protein
MADGRAILRIDQPPLPIFQHCGITAELAGGLPGRQGFQGGSLTGVWPKARKADVADGVGVDRADAEPARRGRPVTFDVRDTERDVEVLAGEARLREQFLSGQTFGAGVVFSTMAAVESLIASASARRSGI